MTEFHVRSYQPEDVEQVVSLILPIQQEEFGVAITLEDQPDLQNIETFYQKGLGNFFVALHDNKIIGTIALLDIGTNQGAMRKFFVHPNFRGSDKGTSSLLLTYLFEWCKEQHLSDLYLGTTLQFIAAQKFYLKNGFSEISTSELPPNFPIMAVDKKFYHMQF